VTYQPNDRVRLTVPGTYADINDGAGRRLGVTLVFRVIRHVEDDDRLLVVNHDTTGRRYVLPAKQLTRVG